MTIVRVVVVVVVARATWGRQGTVMSPANPPVLVAVLVVVVVVAKQEDVGVILIVYTATANFHTLHQQQEEGQVQDLEQQ